MQLKSRASGSAEPWQEISVVANDDHGATMQENQLRDPVVVSD